ncbi:hypothetical protein [Aminipila luticellarii]|uniref:Uncharacterized protein n=1 Tax=Aminipila luticellarii TaxID=2507160 RepID=A0A410PSU0_9FIRM|nr:hypothetical protein [Aminipila luticellarii]QAT41970.1 hypothetical protein EQM06_01300 [Aminipila luticellarii]
MIYVPLLKARQQELRVAHSLCNCFSENIIPLFEILADKYEKKYQTDEKGKFVYEMTNNRRKRILLPPTANDIITLENISEVTDSKLAFIDFFRFTTEKYGEDFDPKQVTLSLRFRNDSELYKRRVMEISEYENLIPVISIKPGFSMPSNELSQFIKELQEYNESIALRITEEFLDDYKDILENELRGGDYFLFDIGEQNVKSKIMELEQLAELNLNTQIILLNSPRKASNKNGGYEQNSITALICNDALTEYEKYSFNGFGDYGGLKDVLPSNGGSNGTGAALALLFDYNTNEFYSFVNPNTHLGVRGYLTIIPSMLELEADLNKSGKCPAYLKINDLYERKSSGNWPVWTNIILTRYIYQIYSNFK